MNSTSLPLSFRLFFQRWFLPVFAVCLLLALVGGYVAYGAHVGPEETVVEERTTGTWSVDSQFDHAATVDRETAVFAAGERLENRPLYFTTVSPVLEGNYTVSHDNTDGEAAVAAIELSLVVRAVEEIDDRDVVHWQEQETLETVDATTIADGQSESAVVSLNVSGVLERIDDIETDLQAAPGDAEVLLEAETAVESTVAGESFTETRTDRLEIEPDAAIYRVTVDESDSRTYEATEEVVVTLEPSLLALYGSPVLLLFGLLGALGLAVANWRSAFVVTDSERTRYEFDRTREDFDEWISRTELPDSRDRETLRAESLSDLVDIAIDSDRRVLEQNDRYVVVVGDVLYTYTAPSAVAVNTDVTPETVDEPLASERESVDSDGRDSGEEKRTHSSE